MNTLWVYHLESPSEPSHTHTHTDLVENSLRGDFPETHRPSTSEGMPHPAKFSPFYRFGSSPNDFPFCIDYLGYGVLN